MSSTANYCRPSHSNDETLRPKPPSSFESSKRSSPDNSARSSPASSCSRSQTLSFYKIVPILLGMNSTNCVFSSCYNRLVRFPPSVDRILQRPQSSHLASVRRRRHATGSTNITYPSATQIDHFNGARLGLDALLLVSQTHIRLGDIDAAEARLEEFMTIVKTDIYDNDPIWLRIHWLEAQIALVREQFARARDLLDACASFLAHVEGGPKWRSGFYFAYGDALKGLGQHEAARAKNQMASENIAPLGRF